MSGNTERLNSALADRYKIEKQLGQGGMATVYLAQADQTRLVSAATVVEASLVILGRYGEAGDPQLDAFCVDSARRSCPSATITWCSRATRRSVTAVAATPRP